MNKEKLFAFSNIALSKKSIHISCQFEIGEFTYKVTLFFRFIQSTHTHTYREHTETA